MKKLLIFAACFPLLAQNNGVTSGTLTFSAGKFGDGASGFSGSNYITVPAGATNFGSAIFGDPATEQHCFRVSINSGAVFSNVVRAPASTMRSY